MPGYKVRVLADSVSPDGVRISSIAYQGPRSVLAELNTHRAVTKNPDLGDFLLEEDLSRNAESSRAISFRKKLELVTREPYFPDDLPDGPLLGESPGMSASAPMDPERKLTGQHLFTEAGKVVAGYAEKIAEAGFHKQDVNRLLEPWSWTRGVITATELANFFALRCDHRAYPPFRFLARCAWVALSISVPRPVSWGTWHLPFITEQDRAEAIDRGAAKFSDCGPQPHGFTNWAECLLARWSAARCARVSFYHFGRSEVDYDKDDDTFQKLAGSFPLHASPLEHQALCAKAGSVQRGFPLSNFRAPWVQHRKFLTGENIRDYEPTADEVRSWSVPDSVFTGDPGTDW